jgi:hypothetical protein
MSSVLDKIMDIGGYTLAGEKLGFRMDCLKLSMSLLAESVATKGLSHRTAELLLVSLYLYASDSSFWYRSYV